MGPTLSMVHASAITPCRLTRPKLGLRPVVPQRVEGETMLPHVSVPIAKPTHPAAVSDAEPADEPLDPWSSFHGLRHIPPNHTSPHASSPTAVFARRTAPASSSFSMTAAFASI